MKYRSVMLDADTYAKLTEAKEALSRRIGTRQSFNDLIQDMVSRNLELIDIDQRLKDHISKYVEKLSSMDFVAGAMLFGSVAKGTYNENSDIDVMILINDSNGNIIEKLLESTPELDEEERALAAAGLPSLISPVVLRLEDTKRFRPFYFDIADYGVVLFESGRALSDFLYGVKRIRHKRELVNNAEVLTWR